MTPDLVELDREIKTDWQEQWILDRSRASGALWMDVKAFIESHERHLSAMSWNKTRKTGRPLICSLGHSGKKSRRKEEFGGGFRTASRSAASVRKAAPETARSAPSQACMCWTTKYTGQTARRSACRPAQRALDRSLTENRNNHLRQWKKTVRLSRKSQRLAGGTILFCQALSLVGTASLNEHTNGLLQAVSSAKGSLDLWHFVRCRCPKG